MNSDSQEKITTKERQGANHGSLFPYASKREMYL